MNEQIFFAWNLFKALAEGIMWEVTVVSEANKG